MSACSLVRSSSKWVAEQATSVSIADDAITSFVEVLDTTAVEAMYTLKSFDHDLHFIDAARPSLTAMYFLVVDSLNYCFWPDEELEYEHLAGGLKTSVLDNPDCISATRLASIDEDGVRCLLQWPRPLPLASERARLLREVGAGLCEHFNGQASEMIRQANGSATALVSLVCSFPGFRDHAIYRGRQVFLYKRAQIFVGDVYGAFHGSGMGAFHDIESVTCFADYRVPVVLRQSGILQYSAELAHKIDSRQQIFPGSEEEIEIRACTIEAVERMRVAVAARRGAMMEGGVPHCPPPAVHLDWLLWETGEAQRMNHMEHHRTETIYY